VVFIFDVLMDRIVGEASQRKLAAGEKNLDLIRGREFFDAVED
jgi:hypothetical protein